MKNYSISSISFRSNENLLQNIYGEEKCKQFISHIKREIKKTQTSEVKQALNSYPFDNFTMHPEIAGKTLKSVSIRLKGNQFQERSAGSDLTQNAETLINEAESYKKFLEDPDLLENAGFSLKKAEYQPICGSNIDCYEGVINNNKSEIKISNFGLEIAERINNNIQKLTFIDWAGTEILFTKENKFGRETIIRKILKILNTDIEDKIKIFQKL